ncbi:MAG: alpha/beta hydrolase [Leptolyngbya sp. SIO4C1]|nr:alpha/beta hydrolase [Leptolyngbya sp. SIO4C1]
MPSVIKLPCQHRAWGWSLGAGLVQTLLLALPGFSAERIYANYGPVERYISVEALETYAETGELTEELEGYSRYLSDEQLEQIRTALLVSADLDVVTVAQFLYTPQGEAILEALGEIVQTAGRQNGALAIRGALILAAANPDGGLNLINVLKEFPTQGIRVDLRRASLIARRVLDQIRQTQRVTAQITQQATSPNSRYSPALLNSLAAAGPYEWTILEFNQPMLFTNLYLPEGVENAALAVLSHGVGGNRTTLAYLAEHLASHGFAVAVVEHPGSSEAQLTALFSGRARQAIEPEELVQRPQAIQDLLDALDSDPLLRRRIDVDQVGVLGQSFGAYTSLALAGATVNWESLKNSCPPEVAQLNLSLLLQCSALTLPQPQPRLSDRRVRAAIAINPLGSAIFGQTGFANIGVPTMLVSGSADTVTPALAEQIRPFTWLDAAQKYLVLLQGGTHFSTIYDPETEIIAVPQAAIGPAPELAERYVRVLSLAFFQTYLANQPDYQSVLSPDYAEFLSQEALPLTLVRELDPEQLQLRR